MKIAFIIPSLANRGPIVFTKYLIDELKTSVELIHVYYFDSLIEVDLGVPTYQINFFDKINFDGYDIVHTTSARPDLFGWFNKSSIGKKWVVSMHNYLKEDMKLMYGSIKSFFVITLWIFSIKSALNIIVSSGEMERYYRKIVGDRNYKIIPYGIDKKNYQNIEIEDANLLKAISQKYTVVGSVGLLIKRKGYSQLVEFLKENPSCAVVIIGDGPEKSNLLSLAQKNRVEHRLFLLGFKHNSIDYYQYFDIYAMTSYSEGFGLAMLEAMSHGLPVVCSNLEIYQGYFSNDDVCLFVPDDLESLSAAILRCIHGIKSFRASSLKLYNKKFSARSMAENHIKFYKQILSEIRSDELATY